MSQLTDIEKIERIEMAPAQMQTMVAKAFIREDIEDEDIQYTFNEDPLEVLNEDCEIENVNEEEVTEGIGTDILGNFTMRTAKPGAGNKCYIRKASGGWSSCIKGKPTDKNCDVLANCVGYACGRFNEIYNEIKGTTGMKYGSLTCNAENFIEKAQKLGLKTGSEPKPGAIICWRKGQAGNSSDGAGHVAIVEKIIDKNTIYTSEAGYKSSAFWNSKRSNKNGRWGMGSAYSFRAFINNPAVEIKEEEKPAPKPEPVPVVSALKVGDKVKIIGTGNGSSYGTSNTAYGIGWTRQILKIYEGRKYPYRVGNNSGTTGYYKANALQKK